MSSCCSAWSYSPTAKFPATHLPGSSSSSQNDPWTSTSWCQLLFGAWMTSTSPTTTKQWRQTLSNCNDLYICRYVHIKRPAFWSRSDRTPSRCVSIVRDVMCHKKHCIPTQQTLNTTGNEHGTRFGARLSCSTRYYAYSSNSPLSLTVVTGCLSIPKYRCM